MLPIAPLVLLLLAAGTPQDLRGSLQHVPADSLAAPLRRIESERGRDPAGGEAALLLGQLHFARGEYRTAADAFTRAAARLEPSRKPEARYWAGLSWLALPDLDQARAALEEVDRVGGPRRPGARYALALIWERAGKPERARALLETLLDESPGEVAPAALERLATLEERTGRAEVAARLRERLLREYPRSPEALRESAEPRAAAAPPSRILAVQIGAFLDRARAQRLAEAATRAGFPQVAVIPRPGGAAPLYSVVIGRYPDSAAVRRDGTRAAATLGVTWQTVPRP